MVVRLLALAGGVAGGVALSQFPEFSQQYLQRLAGQVDALSAVTADFDASAAKSGLTREAALAAMTGTEFLGYRQADMRATFTRHDRLQSDLTLLREAGPVERLFLPQRFDDPELLSGSRASERHMVRFPARRPGDHGGDDDRGGGLCGRLGGDDGASCADPAAVPAASRLICASDATVTGQIPPERVQWRHAPATEEPR